MARAHDQPRSRRVLRLIAAERIIRGVLLLAAGVYLLFHVNNDFGRVAERVLHPRDTAEYRIHGRVDGQDLMILVDIRRLHLTKALLAAARLVVSNIRFS